MKVEYQAVEIWACYVRMVGKSCSYTIKSDLTCPTIQLTRNQKSWLSQSETIVDRHISSMRNKQKLSPQRKWTIPY
jgi:hypothetical protein